MPPKKKTKRAHSPTPQDDTTVESSANTPSSDSVDKPDTDYNLITDPWTDEQETALLKAIIKWKPVGLHKHFRMLAISDYLKSQGYAPSTAEHMRIPGIWKKLGSLYNLEALDEREDSVITDVNEDDEGSSEMYCTFELPYDEYGDMMFERRLAMEESLSPVTSRASRAGGSRRGSTVADTDEPRSSPVPSRGRASRPSTRGTRSTRLQVEIGPGSQGKVSDEGGDSAEDTGANDEDDEEGEEGSEGNTDEDEGESEKGGSRSTRAQTSRSKAKDKRPSAGTATRRTARRR
ncbi:Chromatin modification-related protein EAF7 [Penicillium cf. griseofulvum]|uniref:Chromatin modification-related protein EAF7 n=1 Tax=Penicillium cf. griseofulvum TaxID=2972120 RepID=A0A9W9M492_9EURO|nr:Chromatin modification-related protein EAF7 [Penicillium cf. griseofulvum]KAJ5434123.1 Chromatin modification-related protein EAF7 [Penicillium cf. griseofulvum]KAJ5451950.1 Chromatin modification-related protein EAF7 [Penicillium cf. griseofulvum]